jgi:hypothetical protein
MSLKTEARVCSADRSYLSSAQKAFQHVHFFRLTLFVRASVGRRIGLVLWHASAASLPLNVIFAQLTCPLNNISFYLHREYLDYISTNLGPNLARRKKNISGANTLAYCRPLSATKK